MILIALGSNLPSRAGPPDVTIRAALDELARLGVATIAASSLYRNPAWPRADDPPFVNAVAAVETNHDPAHLLALLHEVEMSFGRERAQQNAPRTLDLDLLDYRGIVQAGPPALPHPRMEQRDFVLVPLAEVAPAWRHPVSGKSVGELLVALPRRGCEVSKLR